MTAPTVKPIADYFAAGEARALAMNNRGPITFTDDGALDPAIVAAYDEHGFYVFTDVVSASELAELQTDIDDLLARAPYPTKRSTVDRHGRPAAGLDLDVKTWHMAAPLTDPWGGSTLLNGRHQVKMHEPTPTVEAPEHVPFMVSGCLQLSDTYLRAFAHPDLLRVAQAINGPDFTPFTEVLFVKEPGVGPAVAWHQDGQTHWDSPDWDGHIHGFNMQLQLWGSTPGNGVWVVPGSHKAGKIDIRELVSANAGSDRLPGAVPLVAGPGDVTMTNRQCLHGSFPNNSPDRRVTVNFGFHKYSSVIDQYGALSGDGKFYSADYVHERCRTIAIAIDARAEHFPDEEPFVYEPFADAATHLTADDRKHALRNYNTRDLSI